MRVTVDKAGRIVVPKPLWDQLRLSPGAELDARVEAGQQIITPIGPGIILVEENGRLVATPTDPTPTMSQDELPRLVDEDRRWPRPS